jgi:4,5-dihydroxyphthalate decarboxylase
MTTTTRVESFPQEASVPDIPLTMAVTYFDHIGDLVRGRVRPEGIDLTVLQLPVEEIFFRMHHFGEWDVSEFALGKYASMVAADAAPFRAIPVFPSRVFRQSAVYVGTAKGIRGPQDLAGRRVGVPEWAQTACTYARGYLQHHGGLRLQDVRWVQAGVNEAGRKEKVRLSLPPGIGIEQVADRSLNEMMLAGEIDAMISAREPDGFLAGDARIARLWPETRELEEAYYRETGVFPIMHVIVIKNAVFERHPWIATNLYEAFEQAKANTLAHIDSANSSRLPFAWAYRAVCDAKRVFGDDFWPYGMERNRRTLDTFLQYAFEQGVTRRRVAVEELFPREVQEFSRT